MKNKLFDEKLIVHRMCTFFLNKPYYAFLIPLRMHQNSISRRTLLCSLIFFVELFYIILKFTKIVIYILF